MLAESLLVALGALSFRPSDLPPGRLPVARYVAPAYRAPVRRDGSAIGVSTTGRSAVVMDGKSGILLFSRQGDAPHPIASLTKLMTAMVVLDAKQPFDEDILLLDGDEPGPGEGRPVLEGGETLNRGELLRALLIGSVNTAGNALARTYPGGRDAFVRAMNDKARDLGLSTASFVDPTGLDPKNVASAEDVARLLRSALAYADIRSITKNPSVDLKGRSGRAYQIPSTNLLLGSFLNKKPFSIVAAKTGSLPEAGFCFAQATQDEKGNELVAVTLGSENHFSRYQDVKALTSWGFKSFDWGN